MISQGAADLATTLTLPHVSWRFWPGGLKCLLVSDHWMKIALPLRHFFVPVWIIWVFCYLWNSASDLEKHSGLLGISRDWALKGNRQLISLIGGLRTQVWWVFVERERTKVHLPSGCLSYRRPYIWPELACERRSAAIPLGSEKRLF